ncbi:MAG: cyclopropane-fatty-acyl-phospholipid synthase family protein [Pseudobdellovibrionaceae bacterium]
MKPENLKTNWDQYYQSGGFPLARLTRAYLVRKLDGILSQHLEPQSGPRIVEFGGGNTILMELFKKRNPRDFLNLDSNELGLRLFKKRNAEFSWARTCHSDLLQYRPEASADLVVSIGLIEHFSSEQLETVIQKHFLAVRPGGLVVITFPTPTWLYRITRGLSEALGAWKFPDETPLPIAKVVELVKGKGQVLSTQILWPQILTQALIVVRAAPLKQD